jgi:hypothetical protein
MRVLKLALASVAALMIGTATAHAIEVNKKTTAPGEPGKIWEIVSDFCSIKDWHPAVVDCQEGTEGGALVRTVSLKGGGKIKEKLLDSDDESYSYEILESPLPVKNYKAKLWVEEDERAPDRTVIHWDAEFDANGVSDAEAAKTIGDIFTAGLKGIKAKALPPED